MESADLPQQEIGRLVLYLAGPTPNICIFRTALGCVVQRRRRRAGGGSGRPQKNRAGALW